MPAGCHDCSLGELRSTFQCIATEREIHRNGPSRKAVNNIALPKTSQHMRFFQAPGGEHRQILSFFVVAEGQMETGLQFAKEKQRVIESLRASAKMRIKFSICSPFAEELERNDKQTGIIKK